MNWFTWGEEALKRAKDQERHETANEQALQVSKVSAPGGTIKIEVEAPDDAELVAYFPGLSARRITLSPDRKTGFHSATMTVPTAAPKRGYCVVRVVDAHGLERDAKIMLNTPTDNPRTLSVQTRHWPH